MRRALLCAFLLLALAASSASARDPITPLADIHRGLDCTALTVVHGTDISSFDVQVLDVVADADGTGARILVRVSGPAVDGTGIAEGFSGSPVYCPDANGAIGNAGAISATIGQYGENLGLVTPIEQMLNLPVTPPSGTRRLPQLLRAARPLASPLTISGLSPGLGNLVQQAALARGHALVAAPAGPLGAFAPQPLVPGASMAVALSSGAVASGAIGTVTYRDGNTIYGFGHPFEGAGRRSLPLQDAYVFAVVGNPIDAGQLTSYKLAAPGHTLGTLTNDALPGLVGTVGAAPNTVPVTVRVKDLDTGAFVQQRTDVADEVDLGTPDGQDTLSAVASLAVAQAITSAFDGAPAQETGRLCLTAHLRELSKLLRFCDRHVVQGVLQDAESPSPLALPMAADVSDALDVLANARFRALHVTQLDATVRMMRGATLATILGADLARPVVRPGQRVQVALRVRVLRGPLRTLRFTLRIPHGISPGPHLLRLIGTPAEGAGSSSGLLSILADLFGGSGGDGPPSPAQSMGEAVAGFLGTARYDGVRASLAGEVWPAYLNPQARLDGRASVGVIVAPRRRGHHHAAPRAIGRILRRG
ncbi:MAG TPA: hypothetical protein VFU94_09120 [Conexibacter sp.]|nr:hypothetical protein [Conexibacter sp.]